MSWSNIIQKIDKESRPWAKCSATHTEIKMRTREEIRQELLETYHEYKSLNKGSPKFKSVSYKLMALDNELNKSLYEVD